MTRTSLGKMTYYFENKTSLRDAILYKEGEQAEYVYIVKNGEFEVTKKVVHTNAREDKIEDIL